MIERHPACQGFMRETRCPALLHGVFKHVAITVMLETLTLRDMRPSRNALENVESRRSIVNRAAL